jgi:putative addiction module component (TIGR02574 family)
MGMDQVIIEREAMSLPPRERALLADALLVSLDDDFVRDTEAAWAQEAEARLEAYHRGETKAVDGPLVLREIRNRYAK